MATDIDLNGRKPAGKSHIYSIVKVFFFGFEILEYQFYWGKKLFHLIGVEKYFPLLMDSISHANEARICFPPVINFSFCLRFAQINCSSNFQIKQRNGCIGRSIDKGRRPFLVDFPIGIRVCSLVLPLKDSLSNF